MNVHRKGTMTQVRIAVGRLLRVQNRPVDRFIRTVGGTVCRAFVEITQFYTHLESVPGLRTLTARCLTCGDAKSVGWHADWSLK